MVNSISNTTQIYATNKINKTPTISAYSDTSSTKPLSRMEQMKEKYIDIYSPITPSYSNKIENFKSKLLTEKFPNYKEELNKMYVNSSENANGDRLLKNDVYLFGNKKAEQKFFDFKTKLDLQYPQNIWDRPRYPISNSKELATFYNASVYESLEKGNDLQSANKVALDVTSSFMDTNEYVDNLTKMVYKAMHKTEPKSIDDGLLKYHQNKSFDIDLTKYNVPKNQHSESSMINYISHKIKEYEFMLTNPSIVEKEF